MGHGRRIAKKYNLTCEDCIHKYSRCYDEEPCYSCVDMRKFELKVERFSSNMKKIMRKLKKEYLCKWMYGN